MIKTYQKCLSHRINGNKTSSNRCNIYTIGKLFVNMKHELIVQVLLSNSVLRRNVFTLLRAEKLLSVLALDIGTVREMVC